MRGRCRGTEREDERSENTSSLTDVEPEFDETSHAISPETEEGDGLSDLEELLSVGNRRIETAVDRDELV
jgi:hypothetical protein